MARGYSRIPLIINYRNPEVAREVREAARRAKLWKGRKPKPDDKDKGRMGFFIPPFLRREQLMQTNSPRGESTPKRKISPPSEAQTIGEKEGKKMNERASPKSPKNKKPKQKEDSPRIKSKTSQKDATKQAVPIAAGNVAEDGEDSEREEDSLLTNF
jgi:hypothetical protein